MAAFAAAAAAFTVAAEVFMAAAAEVFMAAAVEVFMAAAAGNDEFSALSAPGAAV